MNKKNGTIYVICPDVREPIGGIKQLYRHVDILNRKGFQAFIVHQQEGFRADFFENQTPILYSDKAVLKWTGESGKIKAGFKAIKKKWTGDFYKDYPRSGNDVWVIPEIIRPQTLNIGTGSRKVLFNQNAHYTFEVYGSQTALRGSLYEDKDTAAAIVISEHSERYLKYAYPELKIHRVHNGVNPGIFKRQNLKKKQIAFMSQKSSASSGQVFSLLKLRGALREFSVVEIKNRSEAQTAEILGDSLLFFSFSEAEGCPLPPMEAMSCGCVVIGYDGYGGKEYFKPEFCYPVSQGDVLSFSETAEQVIRLYEKDPATILEKGVLASYYIQKEYSLAREEAEVERFWQEYFPEICPQSGAKQAGPVREGASVFQ